MGAEHGRAEELGGISGYTLVKSRGLVGFGLEFVASGVFLKADIYRTAAQTCVDNRIAAQEAHVRRCALHADRNDDHDDDQESTTESIDSSSQALSPLSDDGLDDADDTSGGVKIE